MGWRGSLALLVASCLGLAAAVYFFKPRPGEFRASVLELALNYTTKALCSCLFVVGNGEEECRDYASIEQVSPTFRVDRSRKIVTSKYLWFEARAIYRDPQQGCYLE